MTSTARPAAPQRGRSVGTAAADPPGRDRLRGWLTALAVTLVAAALRLPGLGRPDVLVFDETYYVKDAWTLLHLGYEGTWPDEPDEAFEAGDVDGYSERAAYVVHPPWGKWLIGLGMRLLGAQDPVGWRLTSAVAGVLAVLLLTRVARRLFRSTWLGALAGLLLAVDGAAIVHSRTALLDGLLMVLVLAAFGALLVDRDAARARLARAAAPPRAPARWGPALGLRPWRLLAGVLLGLAVGTKWSGLTFLATFGLLTVAWDASARRRSAVRQWWQGALLRDAVPAFLSLVGVAAVTYLAGWWGWFRSPDAYGRMWAARHPGEGAIWLPDPLRSLWKYHQDMWGFHTTLAAEHSYAAHPAGWLLQLRPTSFFYESPEPAIPWCGADRCSQAVTSLGNPLLWWLATAAAAACVWWAVRHRDGAAAAALSGLVAGWVPWLLLSHRTVFTFYAVVVLPWLVLCLTWATARVVAWARGRGREPTVHAVLGALLVLVLAVSLWFYPLWTARVVTFRFWQLHMWLPGWV